MTAKQLEKMIVKPHGMILSTGPTGSGKSTAVCIPYFKKINQPEVHIITVEDPVEYRIEKIRQVQLNRKAGMTFASGLRSILRQDPGYHHGRRDSRLRDGHTGLYRPH